MKLVVVLAGLFCVSHALPTIESEVLSALQQWHLFKTTHGKSYQTQAEEEYRLTVFHQNMQRIKKHNDLYNSGKTSYKMGVTKFADLTADEFMSYINQYQVPNALLQRNETNRQYVRQDIVVPESVDWRATLVGPVKDQGECGSCWSFSTTGSIEGQYARAFGIVIPLSEQNLIDCSVGYGNYACNGGWMDFAFKYVIEHGLESEIEYPYEAKLGKCRYDPVKQVTKISSFVDVFAGDEIALKEAVATAGPVSVAISVTPNFQLYEAGVFSDIECAWTSLNHGVLAVGYGTELGSDYWIVKNSWGPIWGEHGYIRMVRNHLNNCKIASVASYPVL